MSYILNIPEHIYDGLTSFICSKFESCFDCPCNTVTGIEYGSFENQCILKMIRRAYDNDTHEENITKGD